MEIREQMLKSINEYFSKLATFVTKKKRFKSKQEPLELTLALIYFLH